MLPNPPMELYLDYVSETESYYGSHSIEKQNFDFDGWRRISCLKNKAAGKS